MEIWQHPILLFVSVLGLVFLLVLELADRIRFRDEVEVARQLQRDLLPHQSPELPGYRFAFSYRTANDITLIWEYYYNGLGNDKEQQQQFYRCVHQAWDTGDQDLIDRLPVGKDLDKGPFSRPNPMQRYMNFRVWWEEPRNILYLTPGLQVLYNLDDQSFSVSPEISYTGYENLELRLRATVPVGDTLTEWGEKPNQYKIELRARYYF